MEKITLIMSSTLPVPATKGGAVENILENIVKMQEKYNEIYLNVISVWDKEAVEISKKYKKTNFKFIKISKISKIMDKNVSFIALKILKKDNIMAYSYIFQRLEYYKKIAKIINCENYGNLVLENSTLLYKIFNYKDNMSIYRDKIFYHGHNIISHSFGLKNNIKKTKKFIGVSNFIITEMSTFQNEKLDDRYVVLKNGIDFEKFKKEVSLAEKNNLKKKYNIKEKDKILLFTGRFTKEKGIKQLLCALNKIKIKNVKLLVVGSYFFDTKIKNSFAIEINNELENVKDKVIFTGFIKYDDIYKFYQLADVAVLPSVWDEPAGLTIIESLVSGLPIITTNSGGIPEYATDGSAIILERDENLVENLAKSIDELLNNDIKRKEMAKHGLEVSKKLNLDNYYFNFIDIICDGRK